MFKTPNGKMLTEICGNNFTIKCKFRIPVNVYSMDEFQTPHRSENTRHLSTEYHYSSFQADLFIDHNFSSRLLFRVYFYSLRNIGSVASSAANIFLLVKCFHSPSEIATILAKTIKPTTLLDCCTLKSIQLFLFLVK